MEHISTALVGLFNMAGFFYPPARIQAMIIQSQDLERYAYNLFHSAKVLLKVPETSEEQKLHNAVTVAHGNPYDPAARVLICQQSRAALAKAGWDVESDRPYIEVLKISGKKYFDAVAAPVFMTSLQPH